MDVAKGDTDCRAAYGVAREVAEGLNDSMVDYAEAAVRYHRSGDPADFLDAQREYTLVSAAFSFVDPAVEEMLVECNFPVMPLPAEAEQLVGYFNAQRVVWSATGEKFCEGELVPLGFRC